MGYCCNCQEMRIAPTTDEDLWTIWWGSNKKNGFRQSMNRDLAIIMEGFHQRNPWIFDHQPTWFSPSITFLTSGSKYHQCPLFGGHCDFWEEPLSQLLRMEPRIERSAEQQYQDHGVPKTRLRLVQREVCSRSEFSRGYPSQAKTLQRLWFQVLNNRDRFR